MTVSFCFTKIAVYSFTELAENLLTIGGEECFILSERFNQDPLESFFGKQRARGGRSDNPTAKRFIENTQAIRVGRSLALGGSSSVKRALEFEDFDSIEELYQPLRKKVKHT